MNSFLDALRNRHDFFHAMGCRLSDHGLDQCYAEPCSTQLAAEIFSKALESQPIAAHEHEQFASFLMVFFGHLDAEKGWTKQLHLGALRNVNTIARQQIGTDTGFDAIGEFPQIGRLAAYLDLLSRENGLPRVILYNANPADTFSFATLTGCFQDGAEPGKIQYGTAWWFLDQKQGIRAQLEAVSNVALLSRFIGMVTDSRSFMSFPRHEYFRRVLCELIGSDVEGGALPENYELLGNMIRDICFSNARRYLRLPGV